MAYIKLTSYQRWLQTEQDIARKDVRDARDDAKRGEKSFKVCLSKMDNQI